MPTANSEKLASNPVVVRWTGIWAGGVVALGLLAVLYALGLGIGFASIDVDAAGRLRTVGIFSGVWGALVPLVSLCVGGYIASRAAGATRMSTGFLQASVMWGVVALGVLVMGGRLITGVVSSTTHVAQEVAETLGSAVSGGASGLGSAADAAQALGDHMKDRFQFDADAALQPINEKLRQAGKPAVKAAEIERVARDMARKALQTGSFSRETAIAAVVKETSMSRPDAESLAQEMEAKYNRAQAQLQESTEMAKQKVSELQGKARDVVRAQTNDVAHATAKVFWGIAAALILGLLASLAGGAAAVGMRRA